MGSNILWATDRIVLLLTWFVSISCMDLTLIERESSLEFHNKPKTLATVALPVSSVDLVSHPQIKTSHRHCTLTIYKKLIKVFLSIDTS